MNNEPTETEIIKAQINEAIELLEVGNALGAITVLRDLKKRLEQE